MVFRDVCGIAREPAFGGPFDGSTCSSQAALRLLPGLRIAGAGRAGKEKPPKSGTLGVEYFLWQRTYSRIEATVCLPATGLPSGLRTFSILAGLLERAIASSLPMKPLK